MSSNLTSTGMGEYNEVARVWLDAHLSKQIHVKCIRMIKVIETGVS